MSNAAVKTETRGAVLEILLNRPDTLNAMNEALIVGISDALGAARADEIRVVTIRGEGRGFCAGGDINVFKELVDRGEPIPIEFPDRLHAMIEQLRALPKPVIALAHGACAGAGLSLVLACDLAIAEEGTKFSLAYTGIGVSPDGSSSYFLPRHVGMKRAAELFMTARRFTAEEALELGLINRVVPKGDVLEQGRIMADGFAAGPTIAYGRVKALINASYTNGLHDQLALESKYLNETSGTEDFQNGIKSFLAKQKPSFHAK